MRGSWKPNVTIASAVDLGKTIVDYRQTIDNKLATVAGPKCFVHDPTYKGVSDALFPSDMRGQIEYRGWALVIECRGRPDNRIDGIRALAHVEGLILAQPKVLLDFATHNPQPALDKVMPLTAPGQFKSGGRGRGSCVCLYVLDGQRRIGRVPNWFPTDDRDFPVDVWYHLCLERIVAHF